MKRFNNIHWYSVSVILAGIAMFFVYAWFSWTTTETSFYTCDSNETVDTELCRVYGDPTEVFKFNSPDESANFFWTLRYSQGKGFGFDEPLETVGNNLIRPRSVAVRNDKVGIGSFLGLPLIYGSLAKIVTIPKLSIEQFILLLTPVFAVLGVWFFYLLLSRVFDKNTALVSALLVFVFPGWSYFASRAMYHNVLFLSLLVIGLYFFVKALSLRGNSFRQKSVHVFMYCMSGIFVGLALITRTSEIGWVVLMFIFILIFNRAGFIPVRRHKIANWIGIAMFGVFIFVAFVPVFANNIAFYGQPLSVGYTPGFSGSFSDVVEQRDVLFSMLVSPFGFDFKSIATNAYNYLGIIFYPFSIATVFGFFIWIFSRRNTPHKKRQWGYFVIWLIISAYLLVFYGSWQIYDRIDQKTVSIGTSYVRYWLPIYIGALPFLAYGMVRFTRLTIRKWARPVLIGLFIILLSVSSFRIVFNSTDESLIAVRSNVRDTQGKYLKLRQYISEDSIVVLGFKQADKVFFPQHSRIIVEMANSKDYESLRDLLDYTDVYYYHFAPEDTIRYISKRDFEPYGMRIAEGRKIFGDEWMYRVEIMEESSEE